MAYWIAGAFGLLLAYLIGSTPTGYMAGRLLRGIDIRAAGSGSTGATNVLRTLGPLPAATVLVVDVLKGGIAVITARWLLLWATTSSSEPPTLLALEPWLVCLAGLAVLLGHGRSIWLRFAGGKSVATGLGVLLAVSWPIGLGALLAFAAVLAASRIVSLGSIVAALTAVALAVGLVVPLPQLLLVTAGGTYVIVRHRANIRRLFSGTEPKLGRATPGR